MTMSDKKSSTPSWPRKRDEIKGYVARRDAGIMSHYGPGAVTMALCPLCGAASHVSTIAEASPDSVTFVSMSTVEQCGRCAEVQARAPEIFKWMVGCELARRVTAYEDLLAQEHDTSTRTDHEPRWSQLDDHVMVVIGCTCGYRCESSDPDQELVMHVALMRGNATQK